MTAEVRSMVDQRSTAYRAFLATSADAEDGARLGGADDFLTSVEDQLATWLRTKKDLDLNVSHDNDVADDWRSFTVMHHEGGHGKRHIKATLVEDTPVGQWRTDLLGSSDGWIDLYVRNDRGVFAAVPNLAKYLLDVLPVGDGAMAMGAEPRTIHPGDVDTVVDAVLDPERHGLVFVCGTEDTNILQPFYDRVPRWTRQVHGLGQVFVLTPDATDAYNQRMGAFGAVPWTIRTYYPKPDRDDIHDSRRHRYLSTASLARMKDGQIGQLLGTIARSHAASRPEPPEVLKVRRTFERLATRQLADAVVAPPVLEPATPPDQPRVQLPETETRPAERRQESSITAPPAEQLIALVRQVLGVDEISEEALHARLARERGPSTRVVPVAQNVAKRLEAQQDEIFRLEDEVRAATDLFDDAQMDEAELHERIEELTRQERWLRERLREKEDFTSANAHLEMMTDVPAEWRPDSLVDLVTHLKDGKLSGIVFTGDESEVDTVHSHDTMGNAARVAWDVCCALSDFAQVASDGLFEGSVDYYLRNVPDGCRTVPVKKHAMSESTQTMNQFGADRVFPVPTAVSPDGRTTMKAHFKLANIGMVSPRLYYLDHVKDDGKIYIGYIGRHLRNTQTN